MTTAEQIAAGMTEAQRRAIRRSDLSSLTEKQSARGTLANFGGDVLDWSFRPARYTPLGQQVAAILKDQTNDRS